MLNIFLQIIDLKEKYSFNEMKQNKILPFVSVCTPTFNRRPFIPFIIKCFENQNYPKEKLEWIIIDDGTDNIEDLVKDIPQVKYFKYNTKMTLGKKRNISNEKAIGDIIVYMDDDDYYPYNRISHAVDTLTNSDALCAGSSEMFIYFKHIKKMYKFGPYGLNHATAATFAFKKQLLQYTKFDENASVAEEKHFLKDYTIPFVQLDSKKTILVFSHNHNSFDKKELLQQLPNPHVNESKYKPSYFVKEEEILNFFINDINKLLDNYIPGRQENKPDVIKQLQQIKQQREQKIFQQTQRQHNQEEIINQQRHIIQQLTIENKQIKENNEHLKKKIEEIINKCIEEKKKKM